jgi:hypothetical protein
MKVNSDSGSQGLRAPYFYPDRRVTGAFTRNSDEGGRTQLLNLIFAWGYVI